eukprot:XP_001707912.1 Hypothetical protein GL50803_111854 [Giardia lamblia ATCC 50803]
MKYCFVAPNHQEHVYGAGNNNACASNARCDIDWNIISPIDTTNCSTVSGHVDCSNDFANTH